MEHQPAYCMIAECKKEASWWIDASEAFYEALGNLDLSDTFYLCSDHYGKIQNENGNYTHVRIDTGEMYDITIGGYKCHDDCEECDL